MGGKVLVLDVDETLLNIEPVSFLRIFRKDYKKYKGKQVKFFGKEYFIAPRPRIREFLQKAKKNFKLVAFSVVDREITKQKLELMGIKDFFVKIYGKEDLIDKKKSLEKISKDLRVSLKDIVAIDDMPEMFFETSNIIPIKPFFIGKDSDYEYQERSDNLSGAVNQALSIR